MNASICIATAVALAAQAAVGLSAARAGDPPTVQRQVVLKEDVSWAGHEGVMVKVELPPGAAEGYHTHPAEVFFFVTEGAVEQEVAGKPTVTLHAGDVIHIPPDTVHQATNKGAVPARFAVVFVAEKGKPLTVPAK